MWTLIFSIARKNWQAIGIAILIGLIWWRISAIVGERDDAVAALNAQIIAMDIAVAKQQAKNAELRRQGQQNVAAIEAQHISDIQHIGKQYGRVITNDKASIYNLRTELAGKLREQSASNDRARVSENDSDKTAGTDGDTAIARPSEESAEFYKSAYHGAQQYIETLEVAGAVCAADYNMCKAYVDGEQGRLGVELPSIPQ